MTTSGAIEALARENAQARQEGSARLCQRDHQCQSNGIIERTVGLVAGQVTLKAALEHNIGVKVQPDARMLCWVVEVRCVSDEEVWERRRYTDCLDEGSNTPILEFWDMLARPARGGKWDPRFHFGVFVGMLSSSSEAHGCHRARVGDQSTCGERHESS